MNNLKKTSVLQQVMRLLLPLLLPIASVCLLFFVFNFVTSSPKATVQAQSPTPSSDSVGLNPTASWLSDDIDSTYSMAWGDVNGDGDLDLAVGNSEQNKLYLNENGALNIEASWSSNDSDHTESVAWGDVDGDGDLDLAVGNSGEQNKLYLNQRGQLSSEASWSSNDYDSTYSVAWGDVDGDGDLDLAVGNYQRQNKLYLNEDGDLSSEASWISNDNGWTESVAWGDVDNDGDLDLVVGDWGESNKLYLNENGVLNVQASWSSNDDDRTTSVAWGDVDGDGDLDLAVGNYYEEQNKLYLNQGGELSSEASWSSNDYAWANSVAWGDVDGDGDLDLAVGNSGQQNKLYLNQDGQLSSEPLWISNDYDTTTSVAWGDVDDDGDLDLAVGTWNEQNKLYLNEGMTLNTEASWSSNDYDSTYSVAWGDVDGDGDLDLAVGNYQRQNNLYLNENGALNVEASWSSNDDDRTTSVAWGDVDSDGDLDLAVGNWYGEQNKLYLNHDGQLSSEASWSSNDYDWTKSVAWGDVDNDGDLDLAVGNWHGEQNKLYLNQDGELSSEAMWISNDSDWTNSVAWGDVDGDGDLDLAIGNDQQNKLYLNESGALNTEASWSSNDSNWTESVAWGDVDGDGDLDLAAGNYNGQNKLYLNEGGALNALPTLISIEYNYTSSIAWGDVDSDGDLDLAAGNDEANKLYINQGGTLELVPSWSFSESDDTSSIAWGDVDGDGDLDLAVGNSGENKIYLKQSPAHLLHPGQPPTAIVLGLASEPVQVLSQTLTALAPANFYAQPAIRDNHLIPITYTLFSPTSAQIGRVSAFYSMDGGDHWQAAIAADNSITTNLSSSPYPTVTLTNSHLYIWDTFKSDFFGQSDNVVLRFVAYPQPVPTNIMGSYHYTNSLPGPFQRPVVSTQSYPFRVRGTQVRVYTDTVTAGNQLPNAVVYRLPASQSTGAEPMASGTGDSFLTAHNGYLQGRGKLAVGDQLMALLPITTTQSYTLYHTSAAASLTGLDMFTVTTPGVQNLLVSADNPLLLFDLDLSLEWDARNDEPFLEQLEQDMKWTSQFLYDWSNGQVALGKVRIYHAKENWLDSHVIIRANNTLRPNADLGGIVTRPFSETLSNGQVLNHAYLPGQVRMAPIWNRFGNPDDELGLDWSRTLAHELGHYLLFLPDNYLGRSAEGLLIEVDCQGSAMTDPFRDDYSEFLTPPEWSGECEQTLAHQELARTDWESITTFYDMLDGSYENRNQGPGNLPLKVTQVTFVEPEAAANTLADPFFYVTDEEGIQLHLPTGQAQGYLFKSQGTPDITDDVVMAIGSPLAEQVHARGAAPGDRLCLFDYSQIPRRLGCLEALTQGSTTLALHEVPGWQPEITVQSVTSRTLAITVTQPITSGQLYMQLLPAAHPTTTGVINAPMAPMSRLSGTDSFTQTITLDYPIANGFVRLWATDQPLREQITEFFLSGWGPASHEDGWGPASHEDGWGPRSHRYGWGVSRRHGWDAPVTSNDGQVLILDLDNIYGETPTYGLQSLATPPNLPPWLTPVGQAYRFSASQALTGTLTIMFDYLQREVPNQREDRLWIAYLPQGAGYQNWQLLESSEIFAEKNLASAPMPGKGIYVLISTIQIPLDGPGWNHFSHLGATEPVTEALASIGEFYTSVANHNPSRPQPWLLHDQTVAHNHPEFAALVNDLTQLELEEEYWLYATEAITLYLPGGGIGTNLSQSSGLQLPPTTFYGWLTPSASFSPTVGMPVMARIDGNLCGETTVQEWNGQLAYKIQVMAENISGVPNGCGRIGESIVFEVGGWLMPEEPQWNNSQAWYHPLPDANALASLGASVSLEGRPDGPSDASWIVPLNVTLTLLTESEPAYELTVMTDQNGTFTLTDIQPDTYEIRVKKSTSLQKMQTVTLIGGLNNINFGILREGDADNDNVVDIVDFSILAAAFSKCSAMAGFDERADFNGDGCVTILDFSLLATNFGEAGEGGHTGQPTAPPRAPTAGTSDVSIVIEPTSTIVAPNQLFSMTVQIQAGNSTVDGAQVILDFEPQMLEVHKIAATNVLPLELQNEFDNTSGKIKFAAGTFSDFPSGTFDLLHIQFRALAKTEGTMLALDKSDVTFAGASVLDRHTTGTIIIHQLAAVMLRELAAPATASPLWAFAALALTIIVAVVVIYFRRRLAGHLL